MVSTVVYMVPNGVNLYRKEKLALRDLANRGIVKIDNENEHVFFSLARPYRSQSK